MSNGCRIGFAGPCPGAPGDSRDVVESEHVIGGELFPSPPRRERDEHGKTIRESPLLTWAASGRYRQDCKAVTFGKETP